MWQKKHFILFLLLISSFSCHKKNLKEITIEPSIERILETIEKNKNYSYLVKYLNRNRAKIEYVDDKELNCILYDFKNQRILISRELKESELFLTLSVLKAIYIWKIHNQFKLDELLMEEEILATLQQIHYIFENNYQSQIIENDRLFNKYLKNEFCTYITINTPMTAHLVVNRNSLIDNKCGRPLENITSQKSWFSNIKNALQNNTFFELMYNKDLQKVRRGIITQADAIKNDSLLRSKPLYEIYRDQRNFYDVSMEKINKFESFYKSNLDEDQKWRTLHNDDIEHARYEFNFCVEKL